MPMHDCLVAICAGTAQIAEHSGEIAFANFSACSVALLRNGVEMSLFISMEGPDGSGKTLQMDLLEKALAERGLSVLRSREPGGTVIGEKIRDVILDPSGKEMDPVTEAYLYAASRAQHVAEKIRPALEAGKVVLLDRFVDSSLVYQGIGRGLGIDYVWELNRFAIGGLLPDVTFMVYIDYEEGLRRKRLQTGHTLDRKEKEKEAFHRQVNEGYLELARRFPERIRLIDGARDVETVHKDIWQQTLALLER